MRPIFLPAITLFLGLMACDHQPTATQQAADAGARKTATAGVADEDPGDLPDDSAEPMEASTPPPAPGPYRLLGILDPDRANMVAFALKVPREWKASQTFKRQWTGAVPLSKIYLSLSAPDGQSQIEYLPTEAYVYSDGPLSQQNRAMAQQMGMPTRMADNELPPVPPVTYIKQMLLGYLAQHGAALREVGNEKEVPQKREADGSIVSRGSVDGTLPNGRKARVECRMTMHSQQINGDTYYSWSVVPSITQTATDLDAAYAHTLVAQESIIPNPAWQKLEQETQQKGAQLNSEASRQQHEATMGQINANTAAMTAGHNARMGAIAQQGAANTARHNERMAEMDRSQAAYNERSASQDRQHQYTIDGIRGEARYADPTTGERVKVADDYQHVYSNGRGGYLGTNTPIDAGQVNWQELQKLSMREY
jgi:hypothetical protein